MDYGIRIRLTTPYATVVQRVRDALKEQGFGVLTEIDVRATLRQKLGEDIEDYVIFGACNPALAYRALQADRQVGLPLPCNVVVRADDSGAIVEALDPEVMAAVSGNSETSVADEAARRLNAALEALAAATLEPGGPDAERARGDRVGPAGAGT